MATKDELKKWLEICRNQYDDGSRLFAELLTNEIKRRDRSGAKPQQGLAPLKERNREAAKQYRGSQKLKRMLKDPKRNEAAKMRIQSKHAEKKARK